RSETDAAAAAAASTPPLLHSADTLLLDFDGTLAEIAPRPDAVRVDPALPGLLDALRRRLDGAVAVVSGRRLVDLDRWLDPLRLDGAGLHGAELRLSGGPVVATPRHPAIPRLIAALVAQFGDDPRI